MKRFKIFVIIYWTLFIFFAVFSSMECKPCNKLDDLIRGESHNLGITFILFLFAIGFLIQIGVIIAQLDSKIKEANDYINKTKDDLE